MSYIERSITEKLWDYARQFPVVFLTGPRQSGKSTLLKHAFPEYRHVNLEEKDLRELAREDPRGFLRGFGEKIVIDEAQYAPDLFSYIQSVVDEKNEPGMYILSGSQNFLLLKTISQSLAGRVGILSLLPFSFGEITKGGIGFGTIDEVMFGGFYPRCISQNLNPVDFFPNYIRTYVERDVRLETGIYDLDKFAAFMRICAQVAGTPVNLSKIGSAVTADARTVNSWLNILEESYIIFKLKPYTRKIMPRFSKTPKLYFYDTGLLCSLLGVKSAGVLGNHEQRGAIFENMMVAEYFKQVYHSGGFPLDNSYFWRDASDRTKEIDLVIEKPTSFDLFEIKSSETANSKYADNLFLFENNAKDASCNKYVVYGGPNSFTKNTVTYLNKATFESIASTDIIT
jgi:predicted AAA+ superfamily ATPase